MSCVIAAWRRLSVASVGVILALSMACVRLGYTDRDDERPVAATTTCGDARVDAPETCDTGIAMGRAGACPTACAIEEPCSVSVLVGRACQTRCQIVRVDRALHGDGCCPSGVHGSEDSDCLRCGDGVVELGETCDPPEQCPTSTTCTSSSHCIEARLTGRPESCSAKCVLDPIAVCADDGCCPSHCDATTDADCSSQCGDGQVDPQSGETCEPAALPLCALSCDDGDPCTGDIELGSVANCNVECESVPITQPQDGDGCCLAGSSNLSDSDCAAVCGNQVTEPGEECDGGATCASDCVRLFHPALVHRYRFAEQGVTAWDGIGGANATVVGTTLDGSGGLTLDGGYSDQYVNLPNGIISQLSDATFEAWVTWNDTFSTDHERIFDFGMTPSGEGNQGGPALGYLYLSPSVDADAKPRLSFTTNGTDPYIVDGPARSFPVATMAHVAVVFSNSEPTLSLYLNGTWLGSTTPVGTLSQLVDDNNWLGRSQFLGDAEFGGVLHEFRIYDRALSQDDVSRSLERGPDPDVP